MGTLKFTPKSEIGVREWFAVCLGDYGYSIIESGSAFPDLILEDDQTGIVMMVEAEYQSSNFYTHGHDVKGCDLIVCWIHNCSISLPVLELATRQRYGPNEINEALPDNTIVRKDLKADEEALRGDLLNLVEAELKAEYITFIHCFASDLKAQSEYQHLIVEPRMQLLQATRVLMIAFRKSGITLDNLGPDDLFKLLTPNM